MQDGHTSSAFAEGQEDAAMIIIFVHSIEYIDNDKSKGNYDKLMVDP
jgi:hypothetical protein